MLKELDDRRDMGMVSKVPYHIAAFVCSHVFEGTRPVLYVTREGGDWQFLCGDVHRDGPRLVGIGHLIERDTSLEQLLDLPSDWQAERQSVASEWQRTPVNTKK